MMSSLRPSEVDLLTASQNLAGREQIRRLPSELSLKSVERNLGTPSSLLG